MAAWTLTFPGDTVIMALETSLSLVSCCPHQWAKRVPDGSGLAGLRNESDTSTRATTMHGPLTWTIKWLEDSEVFKHPLDFSLIIPKSDTEVSYHIKNHNFEVGYEYLLRRRHAHYKDDSTGFLIPSKIWKK